MTEQVLPSLRALHEAIIDDLTEHFADRVYTIAAYDPFHGDDLSDDGPEPQPIKTPAILLELEEMGPGEDDGTDRQPLHLSFAAHCILSLRTEEIQLELREFAASVLARVRNNRWGFPGAVRHPMAMSAQPGEFQPDVAGYDSMLVRWEHEAYLGPDIWSGGAQPTDVYLGESPDIGADHENDYIKIATRGEP